MKVAIKVLPRKEVLDTQGRAVQTTLNESGFDVSSCTIGKYIILDVDTDDFSKAQDKVKKIAEHVLYNPLIETYEIEEHRS